MLNISNATPKPKSPHPVLNLGFRIFFLAASVFAILTMLKWSHLIFAKHLSFAIGLEMLPQYWHAHEMVYGYALAVIAGFLLTAVKTWTNLAMPYGYRLLAIFGCWAVARLIFLVNGILLNLWTWVACGFDMLFWGLVSFFVIKPIWQVRQKRQIGIVVKLLLLWLFHIGFYVSVGLQNFVWQNISLLGGFYLVIGVVLTIARRVVPMFIERGIAEARPIRQTVKNSAWLDRASLLGLLLFFIAQMSLAFWDFAKYLSAFGALLVAVANGLRLKNWHLSGIWQRPLLWSLWLSLAGMVVGFSLFALQPFLTFNASLALHAVALSGVGLMTLAMMARVSLGHTARNIYQPPKMLSWIFASMLVAWVVRVFVGLVPDYYGVSLGISQGFWVMAFVLFCLTYFKILTQERLDGLFG